MSAQLLIIGAGPAGIFAAIAAKETHPHLHVAILERSAQPLAKVKISGGGRCNVTHACFDPKELTRAYPRGHKALLGPFTRFQPRDTIAWFLKRGVALKTEPDGRVFPTSDSSQTIIDCLLAELHRLHIPLHLSHPVHTVARTPTGFLVDDLPCTHLLLATGSSPHGHRFATALGHTITPLVPSLFTFNVPTSPLLDLAGISVPDTTLTTCGHTATGPLLLTHWGFSGPAALKLSAFAARDLHACHYKAALTVQWGAPLATRLRRRLTAPTSTYTIDGKTTYKQEFVTAGGVHLDEINFRTLESKLVPQLYFAGEILDIDGITGGYNFQNCWTTGYLAGASIAQ